MLLSFSNSYISNLYIPIVILRHFTLFEDERQCILLQYFERCSRFKKTVDQRLKEICLMQASVHEDSVADYSPFISKNRNKGKDKEKAHIKEKDEHPKKKSQARKLKKNDTFFEELTELEATFFQTVKRVKKNLSRREEKNKMHFLRAQDFFLVLFRTRIFVICLLKH